MICDDCGESFDSLMDDGRCEDCYDMMEHNSPEREALLGKLTARITGKKEEHPHRLEVNLQVPAAYSDIPAHKLQIAAYLTDEGLVCDIFTENEDGSAEVLESGYMFFSEADLRAPERYVNNPLYKGG